MVKKTVSEDSPNGPFKSLLKSPFSCWSRDNKYWLDRSCPWFKFTGGGRKVVDIFSSLPNDVVMGSPIRKPWDPCSWRHSPASNRGSRGFGLSSSPGHLYLLSLCLRYQLKSCISAKLTLSTVVYKTCNRYLFLNWEMDLHDLADQIDNKGARFREKYPRYWILNLWHTAWLK